MKELKKIKPLQELNLLDRFLFDSVLEDSEAAKAIYEIILGKEIGTLMVNQSEREFRLSPLIRSVRMDIFSIDEEGTAYNSEAQKSNTGNLPRRSRYYQAHLDVTLLEPGEINFNKLPDYFQITIAPFDLFGYGKFCYTFRMTCREVPGCTLADGAARIFLNTRGRDKEGVSEELIWLLAYAENSSSLTADKSGSERIHKIHETVCRVKTSEKMGVKYMQEWEERLIERTEGLEEGRKEGREKGRKEGKMEGLEEGAKTEQLRYSSLILKLVGDGRNKEIAGAASDSRVLETLYRQYGL